MKIKCVITDDEPIARKGLQSYVEKVDFLQLEGVCEDALALNTFLQQHEVDLLFLDIEMPYLSGVELLQSLIKPPKVILTTAYEQYALKGYDLEVIDYLLKPISFERFLKAANKAFDFFDRGRQVESGRDFYVKTDGKLMKLSWQDILFIEGMENYICIFTDSDKYIVHLTLKNILEKMPVGFVQVHKSAIVNISAINSIQGNMIEIGQHRVTISRNLKDEVLKKIVDNRLLKR
ncbi:LytR/AlgR family response regulator transcription factor [Olivibacter sitiensis]|uniref:LytR/AlgR family response regulator transcription factor n=1 Tax=Olivibacter sitiensis TaxID=376470 RepID=UPI00040B5113|nr:response regulator transcription factor [Olivibacter sitiensis]